MTSSIDIFKKPKALVGMVHVGALPGTPGHHEAVNTIVERAAQEADLLARAGFDAIIIENMHDAPYLLREVGPEIVSAMTAVACAIRRRIEVPIGIQILAGANRAALGVAHAAGLDFIRAEGFVFASVADEGLMGEADAGPLLRYRKAIGAEGVKILADIKKKHSAHALTADVTLAETAKAAEFFGADGVIVTGTATAQPTSMDDLREVRSATSLPLVVGSGATPETMCELFACADAVIVGSWYKRQGDWREPPAPERVAQIVKSALQARR